MVISEPSIPPAGDKTRRYDAWNAGCWANLIGNWNVSRPLLGDFEWTDEVLCQINSNKTECDIYLLRIRTWEDTYGGLHEFAISTLWSSGSSRIWDNFLDFGAVIVWWLTFTRNLLNFFLRTFSSLIRKVDPLNFLKKFIYHWQSKSSKGRLIEIPEG